MSSDETSPPTEPFRLAPRPVVAVVQAPATLESVSRTLGDIGRQFGEVSGRQVLLGQQMKQLGDRVDGRLDNFHEELSLLRHATLGEGGIQQRVTSVEQRTLGQAALAVTGKATKYFTLAAGALGIALEVATKFYPKAVGPIHTLLDFIKQVGS